MKKPIKKIRGSCGAVYVRCAVVIMLLCLCLSAVLFYSDSMSIVRSVKKRLAAATDGYLTGESVGIYGELDDGLDIIQSFSSDFDGLFTSAFGSLRKNGDGSLSCIGDDGTQEYRILYPDIRLSEDGHLHIEIDFRVEIPIRLGDTVISHMSVPVHINSYYVSKY